MKVLLKTIDATPYFSLKLEKLYALPVLLSDLASLVLSVKDFSLIDSYYRECLQKLLRLHTNTPRSVIFFLAGSLPASAFLHQRQLNLFGMVSRLENNILYQHAQNIFTSATVSKGSYGSIKSETGVLSTTYLILPQSLNFHLTAFNGRNW